MTYETRLQIGDYFMTIDVEGTSRRGFGAAVFFEWAGETGAPRSVAVKHTLPDRFETESKAHQAAFRHAVYVIKVGEVGLSKDEHLVKSVGAADPPV